MGNYCIGLRKILFKRFEWPKRCWYALLALILIPFVLYECVPSIGLTISIMFDHNLIQKYEVEEEYARLDKELSEVVIDKSSPVYSYANASLFSSMELIQCDGIPSVKIGNRNCFQLLFRTVIKPHFGPSDYEKNERTMPDVSYVALLLFPGDSVPDDEVKQYLAKHRHPSIRHTESVFLGVGNGYQWFTNTNFFMDCYIKETFILSDGEDLFPIWRRELDVTTNDSERNTLLSYCGKAFPERAIPVLMEFIEAPIGKSDRSGAICGLASIPGEETTRLLLDIYDKYDKASGKGNVPYALEYSPPREGAKRVYLDMFRLGADGSHCRGAVEACIQFGWAIEAIPLLKTKLEHPSSLGWYVYLRKAIRALENYPIPQQLNDIDHSILRDARTGQFDLDGYVEKLINCQDQEAVMLIAIELAMRDGKITGQQLVNECGKEVLRRLPASLVLPELRRLASSISNERPQNKAQELLEAVERSSAIGE